MSNQPTLKDLYNEISHIKNALLGDKYNPNGYIKRLESVENTQTEFKRYKQRIIGAVVLVTASGSIITFIAALATLYIKLNP